MRSLHTTRFASLISVARCALLSAVSLGAMQAASASIVYTQDTTLANRIGNSSYLQQPDSNPWSIYFITSNWDPGARAGTFNNHPTGVWFDSWRHNWAIFNQDGATMPLNAAFNVFTRPAASNVYVHWAGAGNIGWNYTYLDNIYANNNPYALVWVTPNWNPNGRAFGVYDNHNIGVWYDARVGRWAIFNQDLAAMPNNAAFNVIVESGAYPLHYYVQTATSAVATLTLDNVNINGHPNAHLLVTPVWNPAGHAGVYNNHPIGVYYDQTGKWTIFNEDNALIPAGASFNVWVLNGG